MSLIVKIKKQLDNFILSVDMELTDEVVSVIGMSGSGKSMTLKCIAGIETPDSGFISLNGRVLYDSKKRINLHPGKRRLFARGNLPLPRMPCHSPYIIL